MRGGGCLGRRDSIARSPISALYAQFWTIKSQHIDIKFLRKKKAQNGEKAASINDDYDLHRFSKKNPILDVHQKNICKISKMVYCSVPHDVQT